MRWRLPTASNAFLLALEMPIFFRPSSMVFVITLLAASVLRGQLPAVQMVPGTVQAGATTGKVTIAVDGITSPLQVRDKITQPARINTLADSSVVLVFSNGATVTLGADSELLVEEFRLESVPAGAQAQQVAGRPLVARIRLVLNRGELTGKGREPQFAQGTSFTVTTPVGVADIRDGGTFQIRFRAPGFASRQGEFALTSASCDLYFVPSTSSTPLTGGTKSGLAGNVSLGQVRVPPGQQIQITVFMDAQGQFIPVSPPSPTAVALSPAPTPGSPESNRPSSIMEPKPVRPKPGQTIQPRAAVLAGNQLGTANIGPTAVDARWSNYGRYLQRMINTVQIQWERDLLEQKANLVSGSAVTVKFVMNDEGRIVEIGVDQTTASEIATRACVNAVTARMPYGTWTDAMKADLGNKQEMTFTFRYQ